VRPGDLRLWRVWEEVRIAFRAALLTEEEELVRFRAEIWVRDLDSDGEVREVVESEEVISSGPPFHALNSAAPSTTTDPRPRSRRAAGSSSCCCGERGGLASQAVDDPCPLPNVHPSTDSG
jgi:hypothetical protein